MDDKQRLLMALALGLGEDHELRAGLGEDALDAILSFAEIDKDQFLNGFEIGEKTLNFFDTKKTWEKFPEIVKMYAEKGTPIEPEDLFVVKRANGKRLADMAIANDQISKLFIPEIWKGRIADLEEAYFSIEKTRRLGIDLIDVKREVASLSGQKIREDELKEMGIEVSELVQAIKGGTLGSIHSKLEAHGDHFRKEDMLFTDADGDTAFYAGTVFKQGHFGSMMNFLMEVGEYPDVEFFNFKRGDRASVLDNVIKNDALSTVFSDRYWEGRPQEMMEVYDLVPIARREKFEITPVLQRILDQMYGAKIEEGIDIPLDELTEAVDLINFTNDQGEREAYPIIMLGFPSVWEKFDTVKANLEARGESLTVDDLMIECGIPKRNVFTIAIDAGKFDDAFDIVKQSGSLNADILLQANENGKTTLDHIIAAQKVDELFDADLWIGNAADMERVYNALPDDHKDKVSTMLSDVNIRSLRKTFAHSSTNAVSQLRAKPSGVHYKP